MFGWVSKTFVSVYGAFSFFWNTIVPTPSTADLQSSSWSDADNLEAGLNMSEGGGSHNGKPSQQGWYPLHPVTHRPSRLQQNALPVRLSAPSSSPGRPKRPPTLVLDLDLYPPSPSRVHYEIGVCKPLPAVLANSPVKSPSSGSSWMSAAPRTRTVSNSTSTSTASAESSWSSNSSSSATTGTSVATSLASTTWSYCKKTLGLLHASTSHVDNKGKGPATEPAIDTPPEPSPPSPHSSEALASNFDFPSVHPTSLDGYVRFEVADGVWVHTLAEYDHVHWRMMERALLYPYTVRDGLAYAGECSDWKKNYRTFVYAHSHLNSRERIELWSRMELERYEAELKRCRI